jgi:hypothetical protein
MINSGKFDFMLTQLHLCAFPTIYQKHMIFDFQYLGGRICKRSRSSGVTTEYG